MAEKRAAPWSGRPRTDNPLDAWVHIRCTQAQHAALSAAAERAGVHLGPYVLATALDAPLPRAARRPPVDRVELARLFGLIGRYGSNLYQLVRAANMRGDSVSAAQLEEVAAAVHDMRSVLRRALGFGD